MHASETINSSTASGPPRVEAPLTTATITLGATDTVLYVNPAGTIAALTVKLPPVGANETNGKVVTMTFTQTVTALTVQDANAGAVESSSGAANVAHEYRYVNSTVGWVRWI